MFRITLSVAASLLASQAAFAQSVPPLLNYQGHLTNATGQPLATGQYTLTFNVYNVPTGGTAVWGPQAIVADVIDGYFNVVLSTDSTGGDSIATAFSGQPRYVGIAINAGAQLLPRQQVLSAPFAFHSDYSAVANREIEVIRTVSAAGNIVSTDKTVLLDMTSGGFTVNLPNPADLVGRRIILRKVDVSSNAGTIQTNGGTIDGSFPSVALRRRGDHVELQSDGTTWWSISSSVSTPTSAASWRTRVVSANIVASGGSYSVASSSGAWVASVPPQDGGFRINVTAGTFTASPNCVASAYRADQAISVPIRVRVVNASAVDVRPSSTDGLSSLGGVGQEVQVVCIGEG